MHDWQGLLLAMAVGIGMYAVVDGIRCYFSEEFQRDLEILRERRARRHGR